MSDWFYGKQGKKFGPVDLGAMRNLVASGELDGNTLVWNTTFGAEWRKLKDVAELNSDGSAPAAPAAAPNAATAYLEQLARQPTPTADPPKRSAARRVLRPIMKLVFLAAVAAGGYFLWKSYLYKSPAVAVYEQFAQARFEYRYEDALPLCCEGPARQTVTRELGAMTALRNPPAGGLARALAPSPPPKPEVLNKKYEALSEKKINANTVELKIQQKIRITTEYSPFQVLLVNNHTATLVKDGNAWKVQSFSEERVGAYNPMSGKPL
jgi:hypothetical protein